MTSRKLLALASTAVAGWSMLASSAWAQSTGTETVQELVVTSAHNQGIGGVVSQQEGPKTREIVSQQYISTQNPGGNALSDLTLIPGINFTNDDPFGMSGSGGHISIRGIKGAGIAELVDGVPLNDAGNYAIYPGELVDQEVIANINVITGSTDVDSPTSSSLGGLVNINTLTPTDTFGGFLQPSVGSFSYARIAGLIETGAVGPWGTKGWFEGSDQGYDKYTNQTPFRKWQINSKIYQPLGHNGDFVAVAGFYDVQVAQLFDGVNFASSGVTSGSNYHPVTTSGFNFGGLLSTPWNTDYSTLYTPPSSTSSNASFQGLEQNPTDTGNIRGESRFTLLPNLKLTIDPSYQWVLANGGGSTNIKETDPRLVGAGLTTSLSNYPACFTKGVVSGIDLDGTLSATGAPVCTDTVRLLSPSNTQTTRYTLNTSLIWDFLPDQLVQLAYAYDHGHVRQTGEYSVLQADGYPYNLFGGLSGYGTTIKAADGSVFDKRNRLTDAELDQVSLEYIGKFLQDHLRLDLGVRDPYYARELNQYCYTSPPSAVYCTENATIAASQGYTVAPFRIHTHYNEALPNLGLVWNFDARNSVFFDYSQALNAPINDDLYSIAVVGSGTTANAVGIDNVQPETTTTYELGYRFQSPKVKATLDVFKLDDNNHIVTSFNQFTQDSVDQNVGTVEFYGVEGIIAAEVLPHLNVIGSFSYNHSEDESNIPYTATVSIPTKGKEFTDTPPWLFAGRVTYDLKDFTFGLQFNYVDKRYDTLVNDLAVPSYIVWNTDVRWRFDWIRRGTYLQLNVLNLFNEKYIGSLVDVTDTNNASLPYYGYSYADQGPPRTVEVTLRATF